MERTKDTDKECQVVAELHNPKNFRQERLAILHMSKSFADDWKNRKKVQVNVTKYWIDSDWTKGRNQYLTFQVRIRDEELIGKITRIQRKLSTISCVAPFPKDYFHISIAGFGFLVKSIEYDDDILMDDLQRIINQASARASTA